MEKIEMLVIPEPDFWSTVHAVIRYQRKNSKKNFFEVCMTESDLEEKRLSLLFDDNVENIETVGGKANVN